jgi:hypothetical protein
MWAMYNGTRPWVGLSHAQVRHCYRVGQRVRSLELDNPCIATNINIFA